MKLFENKYYPKTLDKHSFLVTGGAGFIGSNIVEYLVKHNARLVRILDNFSSGKSDNLIKFEKYCNVEIFRGDICDFESCRKALKGIEFVSHQAALGSVSRSMSKPKNTFDTNISGFYTLLEAVRESNSVRRLVFASSSSVYGDLKDSPKKETRIGAPLSPYAISKLHNEQTAELFNRLYGIELIGLRYFNVFGPRQCPNSEYAAVIPLFCKKFITNEKILINGDGFTSRDFTFIENVVQANILSLFYEDYSTFKVFNVATGNSVSLNQLVESLTTITGISPEIEYGDFRVGDIKHSLADLNDIKKTLNYKSDRFFLDDLKFTYDYLKRLEYLKS